MEGIPKGFVPREYLPSFFIFILNFISEHCYCGYVVAEFFKQGKAALGADTWDTVERRSKSLPPLHILKVADGKAVGFIPKTLQHLQAG